LRKNKECDDIHIPFIIKELIIVFVIVTFHWAFISFSASEVHVEHRVSPVRKSSLQEITPSSTGSLVSSKISLGEDEPPITSIVMSSPRESAKSDESVSSQKALKRSNRDGTRSIRFAEIKLPSSPGSATGSPERGTLRKPSSSDTGGSSSDRLVTDAVNKALFSPQFSEVSAATGSYEISDQREPSVKTHKRPVVLSFDGGGYRALFGASYLAGFPEKSRKIREGLYPDVDDYEATDLRGRANILAGTSAGGVNALSYMMKNPDGVYTYSLEQVKQAYPVEAKKIFEVSWRKRINFMRGILSGTFYDKKNLYEALQSKFLNSETSEQTKLSELGRADQSLLIVATQSGRKPSPRLFRSWDARQRKAEDFEAWKVAAATTAAPVYFGRAVFTHEGQEFYLDDGGLSANNPIYFAYKEAELLRRSLNNVNMRDFLFLSIGTGLSAEFVNPQRTQNNSVLQSGIGAIVNAQISASDAAAEGLMKEAFLKDQFKYHRIQPLLPGPRRKLDRHGTGQTLFFHDLAASHLDDIDTINLVKDLDEEIPDLPDKSVLDTSDSSET
jgi:patatin-like phospholipase/acyl hydrolase